MYELTDSIRSKHFNYKEFVHNLDVDAFIKDENILPCTCHDSPSIDPYHRHILTGDLTIVSDPKLKFS